MACNLRQRHNRNMAEESESDDDDDDGKIIFNIEHNTNYLMINNFC